MKKSKRPAARKPATRKTAARKSAAARTRPAAAKPARKRAAKPAAARAGKDHRKQLLLGMFAKEVPVTIRLMKAYPPGQDHFTPHERSAPAARLAHTFAMSSGVVVKAIHGELHMPPEFPPAPATYAEAVESYERGARELLAALEAMPESRLSEPVEFFTGPGQVGQIPVADLLWLMLLDSIHHRGQLSVYVRMAGGRVPSIYGPSADEPWV
ncbi:MAG TPA: DinB family protein [Thermoanaerobaculia bacterium]|nr:DinB family protein [Thermoanaerobaculia bacterium]